MTATRRHGLCERVSGTGRVARTVLAGLTSLAALALVSGCSTSNHTPPTAPTSQPTAVTSVDPTSNPSRDPLPRQMLGDDLRLPDGTQLAAPVGQTRSGSTTGWYAVLTLGHDVTTLDVLSSFRRQLHTLGYRITRDASGVHAVLLDEPATAATSPEPGSDSPDSPASPASPASPGSPDSTGGSDGSGQPGPTAPDLPVAPTATYVDVLPAPGTDGLSGHVQVVVTTTH